MGVQYLADLENATTANLEEAPYLDFEWQDGRLVVYDKIQERIIVFRDVFITEFAFSIEITYRLLYASIVHFHHQMDG